MLAGLLGVLIMFTAFVVVDGTGRGASADLQGQRPDTMPIVSSVPAEVPGIGQAFQQSDNKAEFVSNVDALRRADSAAMPANVHGGNRQTQDDRNDKQESRTAGRLQSNDVQNDSHGNDVVDISIRETQPRSIYRNAGGEVTDYIHLSDASLQHESDNSKRNVYSARRAEVVKREPPREFEYSPPDRIHKGAVTCRCEYPDERLYNHPINEGGHGSGGMHMSSGNGNSYSYHHVDLSMGTRTWKSRGRPHQYYFHSKGKKVVLMWSTPTFPCQ